MSLSTARKAALHWAFDTSDISLISNRENVIYKVAQQDKKYVLRLHRNGYRNAAELRSELQWMAALAQRGLQVPAPVATPDGVFIAEVDGVFVDALNMLPGAPLGKSGQLNDIEDPQAFFRDLGEKIAQFHELCDAWTAPDTFSRPKWNRQGLLGEAPIWGRFWEHPHLSPCEKSLLVDVREKADSILKAGEADLDYGLIHADLVGENILMQDGQMSFIDFDDGGWGFRDFELATTLLHFVNKPDYPDLRQGLLDGYSTRRDVDRDLFDLFVLLRATAFVGWVISRLREPGKAERSRLALDTALPLARAFVNAR